MAKTLIERLETARATVAKLEAQLKSDTIVNNIEVNDQVVAKFGRGEKVRSVSGKVVAVNDGKVIVLTEDFKTVTVRAADITENAAAEGRAPAEPHAPDAQDVKIAEDAAGGDVPLAGVATPQFADDTAAADPLSEA